MFFVFFQHGKLNSELHALNPVILKLGSMEIRTKYMRYVHFVANPNNLSGLYHGVAILAYCQL